MAYGGIAPPGEEKMNTQQLPIRSVFLECRQWRDKTAGETYTSAALAINGVTVAYFPLQYGPLENMEDTARLYLESVGVFTGQEGRARLGWLVRNLGADYYTAKEWRIRRECWLSGEKATAEELREELSRDNFRAVAL